MFTFMLGAMFGFAVGIVAVSLCVFSKRNEE